MKSKQNKASTKKTILQKIVFFSMILFISCTPPAHFVRAKSSSYKNTSIRNEIVKTAKRYIGVRYRMGGISPGGFDCSGYTGYVYNKNRIKLPRTARAQYSSGKRIKLFSAKPGDLVFFNITGRGVSHVGIYMGDYRFLHAPRSGKRVSYASINNRYWKSKFAGSVTFIAGKNRSRYKKRKDYKKRKHRKRYVL